MKFVYHFADENDLKDLYKRVLNAGLMLPLKSFAVVKNTSNLLRPLAVSDYIKENDPLEPILDVPEKEAFEKAIRETEFTPVITDTDVCSGYNTRSPLDVFKKEAVGDFHEIFSSSEKKNLKLEMANQQEYSFIVDTQNRREYPFNDKILFRNIARYVFNFLC